MKTDTGEQVSCRHRWSFFIINTPSEINRIRDRIFFQLSPADDLTELVDDVISKTNGIHYHAFALSSERPTFFDKRKIYDSDNFRFDRDLKEGDDVWFARYVKRVIS